MPATTTLDRRTGVAAVLAAVFLFLGVGPEIRWPVQDPDGSVSNMVLFAGYVLCWTLGAGALCVALLGLDRLSPHLPRSGRIGRRLCLTGSILLMAFGLVALTTPLLTGAPAEWSFLLFALGMLLFVPGGVPLALGLRRAGFPAGVWGAVLVAVGGVVVSLVVEADPWHDLGLFVFLGSWAALGLAVLRHSPDRRRLLPVP